MKRNTSSRAHLSLAVVALVSALALCSLTVHAQAAAQRFVGTITAITGDTLTIKTDADGAHQVQVPSSAVLKRIAPGQKDLNTADTIQLSDLAVGDRVLVKLDPSSTGGTPQALQVVAMKQTDIAQKQQQEREDWQRNGVGGLVKSIDAASGVVSLTTGAGPTAKVVTVHVSKATILKRYAPNSIRFADAQPAPLDAVQVGDQFRARGQKNADGTELNATEVVSGSFRNISGTVASTDPASSSLVVKDLIAKKSVTVHITPDVQMRRLPDMMARMIAARLKGAAPSANGAQTFAANGNHVPQAANGAVPGANGHRTNGDMEQVLEHAPPVQLSELQKGEAIMLVSTAGTTDVTAIKLLVGVQPLLESPEASRNLLANWSMGSGGGEESAAQ